MHAFLARRCCCKPINTNEATKTISPCTRTAFCMWLMYFFDRVYIFLGVSCARTHCTHVRFLSFVLPFCVVVALVRHPLRFILVLTTKTQTRYEAGGHWHRRCSAVCEDSRNTNLLTSTWRSQRPRVARP